VGKKTPRAEEGVGIRKKKIRLPKGPERDKAARSGNREQTAIKKTTNS